MFCEIEPSHGSAVAVPFIKIQANLSAIRIKRAVISGSDVGAAFLVDGHWEVGGFEPHLEVYSSPAGRPLLARPHSASWIGWRVPDWGAPCRWLRRRNRNDGCLIPRRIETWALARR